MNQPGYIFEVKFKVRLAVALLVLGIILTGLYFWKPGTQDIIKFVLPLAGGLIAIYSAYFIVTTLRLNIQQENLRIQREKMHQSLEITKQLNTIDSAKIRTFINENLEADDISPSEFHKKIIDDPYAHSQVKTLLGVFEDASIAVQYGYCDETVLFKSLSFLVPWAYERFTPYIKEERKKYDPRLYKELEKLSSAWKDSNSIFNQEVDLDIK